MLGKALANNARANRPAPALLVRLVLLCPYVILVVGVFSLGSALPEIYRAFLDEPHAARNTQLIGAAPGFGFALTSISLGRYVERLGYRRVLLVSLFLFAIVGAGPVLLHDLRILIWARAFVGAATALIVTSSLVAVGASIPAEHRKRFLGMQTLLGSLAGVVLYPITGFLAGLDWRLPFTLDLAGLLLLPMAWALPRVAPVRNEPANVAKVGRLGLRLTVATVLLGIVLFIVSAFGSLYLAQQGIHNAVVLSFPATAAGIGSMLGATSFIVLHKRLGLNGALVAALLAVSLGLLLAAITTGVVALCAAFLLAGIGTSIFSPSLNEAAIRAAPVEPSRTLGLANGLFYGSLILFPFIVAPMGKLLGGPSGVILCFAGGALALSILFSMRPWSADHA